MGFLKPGAGLAAVLVVGAAALSSGSPMNEPVESAEPVGLNAFRVLRAGRDTGCKIEVGEGVSDDGRLPLTLGRACESEDALTAIRHWKDRADGTVELSTADGVVELKLAGGDGAAYEAFGTGAPLITLVAAGR